MSLHPVGHTCIVSVIDLDIQSLCISIFIHYANYDVLRMCKGDKNNSRFDNTRVCYSGGPTET